MSVIINLLVAFTFGVSFLYKLIEGNIDIILLSVTILTSLNTVSFIKKNKENYNLSNSYYFFIHNVNELYNNKKFDKLNIFIKQATETNFYKKLHIENSDMPFLEEIKQNINNN